MVALSLMILPSLSGAETYAEFASYQSATEEICAPQIEHGDTSIRALLQKLEGPNYKQLRDVLTYTLGRNSAQDAELYAFYLANGITPILIASSNLSECNLVAFDARGLRSFEELWAQQFLDETSSYRGHWAVRGGKGLRQKYRDESTGWAVRPFKDQFIKVTGWYGDLIGYDKSELGILQISMTKIDKTKQACRLFPEECE